MESPLAPLPSGLVTFLFTDIEESTRHWEQRPAEMEAALRRHDDLIGEIVAAHGGAVFKHTGDGLCVAFSGALAAARVALAIVTAIANESWTGETKLKVRAALHSAPAEPDRGDYRGPALNRCARVLDAAHGGQVLLTRATAERLRDHPDGAVTLTDLGEHRLRGLELAELIYQVDASDSVARFPRLRTTATPGHNLPAFVSSFVGRGSEATEVISLVSEYRLVIHTGAPGIGKTRLAVETAAQLVDEYSNGVWMVHLAAISDPGLVPLATARALGLREDPSVATVDQLVGYLQDGTALLLFDNCEHLLESSAALIENLLLAVPGVRVLATSRGPLHVSGERIWHVPSMEIPGDDVPVEELADFDAVQLFADRAAAAQRAFVLDDSTITPAARVCRLLDGVPLALEIAAARLASMPLHDLATRLERRFDSLEGEQRTAMSRHHTLRATLDWSYDALPPDDQRWFRNLAVFEGGFSPDAAAAVCSDGAPCDPLPPLTRLVEASLVEFVDARRSRFRLLRSIRDYGVERLAESGDRERTQEAHARFYHRLVAERHDQLYGPDQEEWMTLFTADRENFRAAFAWSLEHDDAAGAMRLAAHLGRYWFESGRHVEARIALQRVLDAEHWEPTAELLDTISDLCLLAMWAGDFPEATKFAKRAAAVARALGDEGSEGRVWNLRASISWGEGRLRDAADHLERAVAFLRTAESPGFAVALGGLAYLFVVTGRRDEAAALAAELGAIVAETGWPEGEVLEDDVAGWFAFQDGDLAEARRRWDRAAAGYRRLGLRPNLTEVLQAVGWVGLFLGDAAATRSLAEESLALADAAGSLGMRARGEALLGEALVHEGRFDDAVAFLVRATLRSVRIGDRYASLWAVSSLAHAFHVQGDSDEAAELFGAARSLLETVGIEMPPAVAVVFDERIAAVRNSLGDDRFQMLWDQGRDHDLPDLPAVVGR